MKDKLVKRTKTRKETNGPLRNKARTKERILDSVGSILVDKGYSELTITGITKVMGMNIKLIYLYFGTVDGLIENYIARGKFWSRLTALQLDPQKEKDLQPIDILFRRLSVHVNFLMENKELIALLAWDLGEKPKVLKEFSIDKKQYFEKSFFCREITASGNIDKAMLDILLSGLTTLCLYSCRETSWMGLSLENPQDYLRVLDKVTGLLSAFGNG